MRPFRRRAARIARPARVLIRWRKPCVLARRRLFGWNVRLLTVVGFRRVEAVSTFVSGVSGRLDVRPDAGWTRGPAEIVRRHCRSGAVHGPLASAPGTRHRVPWWRQCQQAKTAGTSRMQLHWYAQGTWSCPARLVNGTRARPARSNDAGDCGMVLPYRAYASLGRRHADTNGTNGRDLTPPIAITALGR